MDKELPEGCGGAGFEPEPFEEVGLQLVSKYKGIENALSPSLPKGIVYRG
jgi:hypothetical protein